MLLRSNLAKGFPGSEDTRTVKQHWVRIKPPLLEFYQQALIRLNRYGALPHNHCQKLQQVIKRKNRFVFELIQWHHMKSCVNVSVRVHKYLFTKVRVRNN